MNQVRLVQAQAEFEALLPGLRREPVIAIDTEAASFHRYHDRIYLIQISTRRETVIVDPLGVPALAGLGALMADPAIEIVFHDADYDLRLFHHQYGFEAARIFDTRVAAELLNEPGLSLAALLERHFGVLMDKRFQRADWSARPLTTDMLAYAASDTAHLVALRDLLAERLVAAGRMEWALEEFAAMTQVRWDDDDDREPAWLRIKGARALPPRQLAILRALHEWRRDLAERTDRAEFRILGNEAMLAIAQTVPASVQALGGIKGVGRDAAERRGKAILAVVEGARRLADANLPRLERPPRRPRELDVEARLARLKAARGRISERLGLEPGVACPNAVLEQIARRMPASAADLEQVPGLRRWQVRTFGEELLEALRTP